TDVVGSDAYNMRLSRRPDRPGLNWRRMVFPPARSRSWRRASATFWSRPRTVCASRSTGMSRSSVTMEYPRDGFGTEATVRVPTIDGDLTGDDDGAGVVAVFDNFEQIAALFGGEGFGSPVIEDEQVDAGDLAEHLGIAAVACEGQGGEEPGNAMVGDGEIVRQ